MTGEDLGLPMAGRLHVLIHFGSKLEALKHGCT